VRGKLRRDPVYFALTAGLLPSEGRLLDFGCGRGILIALLLSAPAAARQWPADWAPPPAGLPPCGIERRRAAVETARLALAGEAEVSCADLRHVALPDCGGVLCDVLQYLRHNDQEALLEGV
jgi:hypothetical protein